MSEVLRLLIRELKHLSNKVDCFKLWLYKSFKIRPIFVVLSSVLHYRPHEKIPVATKQAALAYG